MPIDPNRAATLFNAALALAPGARPAFLAAECGPDADLRARVERLLAAHDDLGDPSTADPSPNPATATFGSDEGATADLPGRDEHVGAVLGGKYKLVEEIGEGGMGSVYMAQQTEPVKRAVAVKVIKAGMDSKAVLARFEAERQALAMMDHPNIARVLDAGTTESGRPYFVMELVKGVPITQYCDERKLTPRQRLELFVPVCNAIQHAHQKGVIHRDIKPSNVLVALYDDKPVPKVIDFGVAKAAGQTLTDRTLMTGFGAVVGTPEYMSPEQASLNNLDIDTRSDVYSLGVLLYELLTGHTPVDRKSLGKAALLEVLRIVREVEAPKPSAKLSAIDTLPSVAANRGTEPKKLTKLMKGELDWVLLKALEKDRTRRYDTANGLARDIQRFLADEIVEARPPTVGYRLKKFVQKNKATILTAFLFAVTLKVTTLFSIWQMSRAFIAETIAAQERDDAQSERVRAEANAKRAIAAAEDERKAVLEATAKRKEAEAATKAAEAARERALESFKEALGTLLAATGPDVEKLIGSRTELSPNERAYLEAVAKRWQEFAKGRENGVEFLLYKATGHTQVAHVWRKLGRLDETRAQLEAACETYDLLLRQVARPVPDAVQKLADARNDLGVVLMDMGKQPEAFKELQTARALRKALADQHPTRADYQRFLAASHQNLGIQFSRANQGPKALAEFTAGRNLLAGLLARTPDDTATAYQLVNAHYNLGQYLSANRNPDRALVELTAARDLLDKLMKLAPNDGDEADVARIRTALGDVSSALGNARAARREYEAACDTCRELVKRYPSVPGHRVMLAEAANKLGVLLVDTGDLKAAAVAHSTAMEQFEKLVELFPTNSAHRVRLGGNYCNRGLEVMHAGKSREGLEWFDKAIATLRPVYDQHPTDATAKTYLRNSYQNRAGLYANLNESAKSLADFDRAVELSGPDDLNKCRACRVSVRYKAGLLAEAIEDLVEVEKTEQFEPRFWLGFARMCAEGSAKFGDKEEEYGALAVRLIRRAVDGGLRDAQLLRRAPSLAPLRDRDDFKKLVADLEKQFPPPLPVAPPPRPVTR